MLQEISFGAVIIKKENKDISYLLLHKKQHEQYSELWDFPRGVIEKGEKPEETAKREIKEETGIITLKFIEGFKEKIKWFYRKYGKTISKEATYFLAETKTQEVKISKEHDNYKWCSYEEASKLITYKNTKVILEKANKFLNSASYKII